VSGVGRARPDRQPRGRATRARIVEAAARLFVCDGYLATTMAAIAEGAGVAVQSLYLSFGSKLGILSAALDVAIVGDDQPIPLLERGWVRELVATADGAQAVRLFVGEVAQLLGRTYPLYAVIQAAAASEAGALLAENKRQRYEGVRAIATHLSNKPGFGASLDIEQAADLLYALVSEEHYGLLVVERGWSADAWQRWCANTLVRALFPGTAESLAAR
jgi:AcrR family transcriptional regulator